MSWLPSQNNGKHWQLKARIRRGRRFIYVVCSPSGLCAENNLDGGHRGLKEVSAEPEGADQGREGDGHGGGEQSVSSMDV